MWVTILGSVAALCSLLAIALAWRGPRAQHALAARIETLEIRVQQLGELVTREQRRAIAADARAAKLTKDHQRQNLAEQAAAVIAAAQQPHEAPAPAPAPTREQLKAELRRRALNTSWR